MTDLEWCNAQALTNSARIDELKRIRRGLRLATYRIERRIARKEYEQRLLAHTIVEANTCRIVGLQSNNTDIHDPEAA